MHSEVVIVGGGAGGLELACKLGRQFGPGRVTLVDSRLYHIWKPSLHEVAAGTLDVHQEGLSYQMLAHDNAFRFVYGPLTALDPHTRRLTIGAVQEGGQPVLPERTLDADHVVIAVGSVANYFGVPGAAEHTIALNATEDAEHFRLTLLRLLTVSENQSADHPRGLDVVIIGGGATGVELAAELREASRVYAAYGLRPLVPQRDVRITLLEGAPRILAPLPERVASAALKLLEQRAVHVVTDCRVTEIGPDQVKDGKGNVYPVDLCVWAAGIKAPPLLANLGLPLHKHGQIEVDRQLRVPGFEGIYALGDCAACPGEDGKLVPPRAQAAHQQADYLCRVLRDQLKGHQPPTTPYVYHDYGSLVSFGTQTSVGTLMGSLRGLSWFVEGFFARIMYASLHLLHHRAILGTLRTGLLALARFLIKRSTPLVKLH
ncbi:NAD(P)/FAD-dependent oxidoreductase [Massilia sp. TS11]|uniref:NAD(P)/FAD-dependent oxidoreductase n=1 Tax=Massilia sp. TS11 TaxID=2908003 RepID=UPI001EDBE78D|nr:NAD(P)/FAD-dependent oxidoreductase [Massilia sp. TS11]